MKPILVTGATGYIGGRLIPMLLERGYSVRCLARDPKKLEGRPWTDRVQVVRGDVLDPDSLRAALVGCPSAYYLVHSMVAGEGSFIDRDRAAARNFASAAESAGLDRVVYLGGLGRRADDLSPHLASRQEVGDILRGGAVPVTELRAAMIIGSGSASFEMMRSLIKRLPVMICPRWVSTRNQPIAVRDVLAYLVGCLEEPRTAGRTLDVGGPDILTYKEMMIRFAAILGLRRRIVVVPVLTPTLSAYWINLVTPIPAALAFPLVEGLKSEVICQNDGIRRLVPITPTPFGEAVQRALDKVAENDVSTRWANAALPSRAALLRRPKFEPDSFPLRDVQRKEADAPAPALFDRVKRIGGSTGYYYGDALWRIRGAMDRVVGGVGLRRGRRDPVRIYIGDALDFWRVEDFVPGRRLLLHAEMRVPGEAWLEFRVDPIGERRSVLTQTAYFKPSKFWGRLYWYASLPAHLFIFSGMASSIVRSAEAACDSRPPPRDDEEDQPTAGKAGPPMVIDQPEGRATTAGGASR
ncbi:SDR family oxidoreductase [Tautonia plasticadhaerens]|uniref:3 beta-hydroxysteroid dehydrogenase/Delta 5-->4-isomerase n=1 Tax=Tautonia plasticadhaerens TaxID=2527974 RepID=A0A518H0D6_9BACT|nr:SDR family oxidoreductase [Tautonia plasticadhaerens]QDV34302.1 3 beta-hydroxysteroid dehydrogenase/Delta 5-->4-isomerase [Tautonia plasticadhaerens]